ncbi:GNAT family N-acetyltransferase [Streptomyces sp. NPDC087270]|uniref:GNAT family N-acetyltransferase n=1 Tax=Streptomyces sp. NPDC087270 TaxID=3365774 RepID=UPI0037FA2319
MDQVAGRHPAADLDRGGKRDAVGPGGRGHWTMLMDHWPLLGLRLTTPRLELRLPSEEELGELADLAAGGIHEPDRMPFIVPWTDLPPAERARSVVQHHWLRRGNWTGDNWDLNLSVFKDGRVVGLQAIAARDFAALRQVSTASWLGIRHQRQGIGTEMRAAALHLAFVGLGAADALSGAFEDNASSFAVSGKLGYEPDGVDQLAVRGRRVTMRRLRLSRARWETHQHVSVTVAGLRPCLPLFGLPDKATA